MLMICFSSKQVFCELYSCLVSAKDLFRKEENIVGIIFSGGPHSVYEKSSPHVHKEIWDVIHRRGIPVLGICYGMQEIAHSHEGKVAAGLHREYGKATVKAIPENVGKGATILEGLPDEVTVWMSHGDKLEHVPDGFVDILRTKNCPHAAIAHLEKKMYALQFHPEVTHTPLGNIILRNFCVNICNAPTNWNMSDIAQLFIKEVQDTVGSTGQVIGAVSGGVDSSVAAKLLQMAIGDRFHAILVDNGCLRKGEAEEVVTRLRDRLGINLHCVNAQRKFLDQLENEVDPEKKRKVIGKTFIEVFQEEANRIGSVDFLLQGTLYPDVIESISYKGPSATIKSHHNVGGLPSTMKLKLIEPLRELFKDEVRELGIALGVEPESVWRHPFPGPGLAIRCLAGLTEENLDTLREADAIMIEELHRADKYRDIGQAFVVLLPVRSVGVMGDCRTYERVCCIRCVQTTDYMTADWYHMPYDVLGRISNRIINEVKGINRVCYDISSKPPATIEWE